VKTEEGLGRGGMDEAGRSEGGRQWKWWWWADLGGYGTVLVHLIRAGRVHCYHSKKSGNDDTQRKLLV